MRKFRWSSFAGASLSALAFALSGPESALADSWGSHGSSGGSYGSSGGSHGSSGGLFSHKSHGSSGGSHGSNGGLFSHKSHGSSGGSHGSNGGSHGSNGGLFSHKSHGSSGGSYGSNGGSYGSSGGYYVASNASVPSAGVAYMTMNVPENAKVYFQDQLMMLSGTQRRFVTPELQLGAQHVYTVRVEVQRDGQTISKTTQAPVTVGQDVEISVTFDKQNPKELVASVAQVASR